MELICKRFKLLPTFALAMNGNPGFHVEYVSDTVATDDPPAVAMGEF